nr:hypothetical protein [Lachnospiraceae bacterium]
IRISFKGNYSATSPQEINFTIAPAVFGTDIVAADVAVMTQSVSSAKPAIKVMWKDSGTLLNKKLYDVTFKNAEGKEVSAPSLAGEYTACIAPIDGNFTGSINAKLTVVNNKNRDLAKGKVKLADPKKAWTGSPVTLEADEITVTDSQGNKVDPSCYNVSYIGNNVNPGKVTAMITANDTRADGYVGSLYTTFIIKEENPGDSLSFEIPDSVPYAKSGAKPAIKITDRVTGKVLKEGTDYKLSCSNNKNVTGDKKSASVKVTGKGKYKFTKVLNYAVTAADFGGMTLTAKDVSSARKWNKPSLTLKDASGKTVNSKCYKITGFEVGGKSISEAPEEGTMITVKIEPVIAEYTGVAKADYCFVNGSKLIYKATEIKKISKTYDGSVVKLSNSDMTGWLTLNNTTLKPGENFVVTDYTRNDRTGAAKVTIRGIAGKDAAGNLLVLGGIKTITFSIETKRGTWKNEGAALIGGEWK